MGAGEAGRDRRRRRRGRGVRPDGEDDAGRHPEEQPDEAADGRLAQRRRLRRGGADLHEVERRRPAQGADRLFAHLHAAALGQDPVQLARAHAGVHHRARPVRAVGQHHAAPQEREGIRRGRQGRQPAVQDGRHRLQARGPRPHRLPREEDRREIRLAARPVRQVGEAATQLVGNHTQSNVNNPSENLEVWRAGQVRALCVFDKERIQYRTRVTDSMSWNDIPTCRDEGVDVQYLMLRAMFLPGKVAPDQTAFYVDLFKKLTQTPEYKDYMEKQALKPVFLTGRDMLNFLEEDDALNKTLMTEAGFVAN